jgi:hypothetical protein
MGATSASQWTHRPCQLPTVASQWTHRSCQLHQPCRPRRRRTRWTQWPHQNCWPQLPQRSHWPRQLRRPRCRLHRCRWTRQPCRPHWPSCPLIDFVGLISVSLNGFIGFSIIAISLGLAHIDFEIGTKHSQRFSLVRESWLWGVRRVTIVDSLISLWPDFCFEKALQNAKQLFFIRLQQMTKYFVMRECENIPRWISLCCDSAFAHKKEFSIFKFSERFSKISWTKTSLYWLY